MAWALVLYWTHWSSTVTPETEDPLQPMMKTVVGQAVSLQPVALQHCGSVAPNSSSSERWQPW